jgi:hypothetical protein
VERITRDDPQPTIRNAIKVSDPGVHALRACNTKKGDEPGRYWVVKARDGDEVKK